MPDVNGAASRYRHSTGVHLALWCVIGLGLVPAIVTDQIAPLAGFGQRFGVEVGEIAYLSGAVSLFVFVVAVAGSILQRRYWLLPLLLPWLALVFFDIEQLSFRMPTQVEALERLHENQTRARELEQLPDIEDIEERIDRIVYTDTHLMSFDVDSLRETLSGIEERLGDDRPGLGDEAAKVAATIRVLSRRIDRANAQINSINESLRTVNLLSRITFGLTDRDLKRKLRNSLKKVRKDRDRWVSQRNAQRVELDRLNTTSAQIGAANAELRDLDARVNTYLWVSEAYISGYISVAYQVLCFGVLLVLIWRIALGSWIYLLTVAASLLVTMVFVEASLPLRLWVIVKFVILSLILRALFRVFSENYPLLRRQSWSFLGQTAKTTLIYYLPFIVLIGLGILFSMQVNRVIDAELYDLKIMREADIDPAASRRYNIDRAIDKFFEQLEEDTVAGLVGLEGKASTTPGKVADDTVKFYEETVKETLPEINPELAPPDCGGFLPWVFDTPDCAERAVLQPLNDMYTETRNEQRDSLKQSTGAYAQKAGRDADKAIAMAREDLAENFRTMKRAIKTQLNHVYLVFDFYAWVSLLILVVLVLKSLMYIFSRVFFATDVDGNRLIQFEPSTGKEQSGKAMEVQGTLALEPGMGAEMYLNKKYDFANAPPDEVTPQAHKGFFSRLRHGVWHMNRVRPADQEFGGYVPFRRIPADEGIVVWTLKPGDAVVFSWKDFVGMNDSIKIRTQYSWQLSSLVFGRMFFVVASVDQDAPGDGTLLLTARGSSGVQEENRSSNSPDQLLAWQTTTRFRLRANLSFRNVYRSGIQISAFERDLAIMHLNDRKQRTGAAAFLKYFLVPV